MPGPRNFLRVVDWEKLQVKGKQMHWCKHHIRWLERDDYLDLSLTDRGVLADLHRLAGIHENRIPFKTTSFLARRIGAEPKVVGKAVSRLCAAGFCEEFDESETDYKNNNIAFLTGSRSVLQSDSASRSTSLTVSESDEYDDDIPF